MLIELPRRWVCRNALLQKRDRFVRLNFGQNHCAVFVSWDELRIQSCRDAEQRRELAQIERREIVQAEAAIMRVLESHDFAADILQRTYPVPIGSQSVERQRQAF